MNPGIETLSEREKDTLRLLLRGHDAKSIARDLGLSVHTVNERLRDARRKLGVSSSREAARQLGEAECGTPDSLTDKQFGVAETDPDVRKDKQPDRRQGAGRSLAWLSGGMLVMSLIIAALVLSPLLRGGEASLTQVQAVPVATTSVSSAETAETRHAREWVALLDEERWDESWRTTGTLFRSELPAAQWNSIIQPFRKALGAVSSRTLRSVTRTDTQPGAPAGEYEHVVFETNFANKSGAAETVVLVREGSGWQVAGYFVN
ncbi:MAG: DUF4019 domain-containing protein [Porphyrobacter sp.]|nr:DUF4019 domain-containing protein [Porphyrobacter sp.]